MQYVKEAFGFVILALPVFLLERVIGDLWGLRLWSLLGLAFFGWAFALSLKRARLGTRPATASAGGGGDRRAAVAGLGLRRRSGAAGGSAAPDFTRINNVEQLDLALQQARGKPVMLDLYADWCVACKEFEKYTFSDAAVQASLANAVLLQADVTANGAEQAALLKHLQVLGLPTILFFDPAGQELTAQRVTGFMKAEAFNAHLQKVM